MPKTLNLTDPALIAEREEFLRQRQGNERSTIKEIDLHTGTVKVESEVSRPDPGR